VPRPKPKPADWSEPIDVRQLSNPVLRNSKGFYKPRGLKMTTKDKSKDTVSPMNVLIDAMQNASTALMPGFGPEWLEAMSKVGHEMLTFMSERVKEDIQTQQALLQAKGIAEIQQIQADFLKRAQEDYTVEMAKLVELGTNHHKHATPV